MRLTFSQKYKGKCYDFETSPLKFKGSIRFTLPQKRAAYACTYSRIQSTLTGTEGKVRLKMNL